MSELSPQLGNQPKDLSPSLPRDWAIAWQTPLIWVVNDDPVIRDLLESMLGLLGCEVESFEYATPEMRARLESCVRKPALFILDMFLPGADGHEICRDVVRPVLPDTPAILLSEWFPQGLRFEDYGLDGKYEIWRMGFPMLRYILTHHLPDFEARLPE